MIETKLINYLKTELGVSVTAEVPKSLSEYIVIQKLDGGRSNYIDSASISVTSVSSTLNKSAKLDKRVRDAMYNMPSLDDISKVELGGCSSDINTATKTYAYESIFNITYYE